MPIWGSCFVSDERALNGADRRVVWSRADLPFLGLVLGAGLVVLYVGRSMTFWQDEWGLIGRIGDGLDAGEALQPWNEHWTTIPVLLYAVTFRVFGLHSYLPYLAELIALHLLVVLGVYVLARRRIGRVAAGLVSLPLLFVGSGSENLFWSFQTAFVGAAAFGTWALAFVERPGRVSAVLTSLALTAALMCSGIGLVFLVAMAGRTLFDTALRQRVAVLAFPLATYVTWFALIGRQGLGGRGEFASVSSIVEFVFHGIGHAIATFTGLSYVSGGSTLAVILLVAALPIVVWGVAKRHDPPALALGSLLAIGAMYTLIGLVRAELESDFATRGRYVYIAAIFVTLAVADTIPRTRFPAGLARWRRAAMSGAVVIVGVATMANVVALRDVRDRFLANADRTRAYVGLAMDRGNEPWVDPTSVLPGMPPLPRLVATIERHGSPLEDRLFPSVARRPRADAHDWAVVRMLGDGFRTEEGLSTGAPIALETDVSDATAREDGDCVAVTDAGRRAVVRLLAPAGGRIRLTVSDPVDGEAALGRDQTPSRSIPVHVDPGRPTDVVVPDTGDGGTWRIWLRIPNARGSIEVCGLP
jgi:hypothetical protein